MAILVASGVMVPPVSRPASGHEQQQQHGHGHKHTDQDASTAEHFQLEGESHAELHLHYPHIAFVLAAFTALEHGVWASKAQRTLDFVCTGLGLPTHMTTPVSNALCLLLSMQISGMTSMDVSSFVVMFHMIFTWFQHQVLIHVALDANGGKLPLVNKRLARGEEEKPVLYYGCSARLVGNRAFRNESGVFQRLVRHCARTTLLMFGGIWGFVFLHFLRGCIVHPRPLVVAILPPVLMPMLMLKLAWMPSVNMAIFHKHVFVHIVECGVDAVLVGIVTICTTSDALIHNMWHK